MHAIHSLLLCFLSLFPLFSNAHYPIFSVNSSLTAWIKQQNATSLGAMLENVGYEGTKPWPNGVVIASPSTNLPDYYYQISTPYSWKWLTSTGQEIPRWPFNILPDCIRTTAQMSGLLSSRDMLTRPKYCSTLIPGVEISLLAELASPSESHSLTQLTVDSM